METPEIILRITGLFGAAGLGFFTYWVLFVWRKVNKPTVDVKIDGIDKYMHDLYDVKNATPLKEGEFITYEGNPVDIAKRLIDDAEIGAFNELDDKIRKHSNMLPPLKVTKVTESKNPDYPIKAYYTEANND